MCLSGMVWGLVGCLVAGWGEGISPFLQPPLPHTAHPDPLGSARLDMASESAAGLVQRRGSGVSARLPGDAPADDSETTLPAARPSSTFRRQTMRSPCPQSPAQPALWLCGGTAGPREGKEPGQDHRARQPLGSRACVL